MDLITKYGTGDNWIDCTELVKKNYLQNNQLIIPAGSNFNKLFGDPIFGKPKQLIINYRDKQYAIHEYPLCEFIIPLVNFSAYYGIDNKYTEVTNIILSNFSKGSNIYIPKNTSFKNLFFDPNPNKLKQLLIYYKNQKYNILESDINKDIIIEVN